jgi:hypothetical protein
LTQLQHHQHCQHRVPISACWFQHRHMQPNGAWLHRHAARPCSKLYLGPALTAQAAAVFGS